MTKVKPPKLPVNPHRYVPDVLAAEDHRRRLPCMCGLPERFRVHANPPADDSKRITGEKDT
jgi:hypothetical protein